MDTYVVQFRGKGHRSLISSVVVVAQNPVHATSLALQAASIKAWRGLPTLGKGDYALKVSDSHGHTSKFELLSSGHVIPQRKGPRMYSKRKRSY